MPRGMAVFPGFAGLIGIAACYCAQKKFPKLNQDFLAWCSGLLVLIVLGALWGIDAGEVWERVLKSIPLLFAGLLLVSSVAEVQRPWMAGFQKHMPFIMIAAGVFCIIELSTNGLLYPLFHDVLAKINDKSLAFLNRSVIVFCVTALAIFFLDVPKRYKAIVGILILIILFLTESQSVQLAMMFAFLAALLPAQSRKLCILFCVAVSALILSAPFLASWLFHDVASTLDQYAWFRNGYAADRTEIWDFVSRRALERPILGHGIEATRLITDFDIQGVYYKNKTVLHPHNFALQIWIEFGVLGALFFSSMLSFIYYRIWRMGRASRLAGRFCMAVFTACLCMAATSYGLWQGWWLGLFTYVLALCCMVTRVLETKDQSQ